jgi:hypothetical protein
VLWVAFTFGSLRYAREHGIGGLGRVHNFEPTGLQKTV